MESVNCENENYRKENNYFKEAIEMKIKLERAEEKLNWFENALNLMEKENDLNLVENSGLEYTNIQLEVEVKRLSDANQISKAGISLHETKIKEVNYFKASPVIKSIAEFEDRANTTATGTTPIATMVNSND